jgi:hypothetical protein
MGGNVKAQVSRAPAIMVLISGVRVTVRRVGQVSCASSATALSGRSGERIVADGWMMGLASKQLRSPPPKAGTILLSGLPGAIASFGNSEGA